VTSDVDASVIESIRRWPNVPSVFGWLSLNARGQWRIHPDGQATAGGPGEAIQNTQILQFIDRNYGGDGQGRWFFQNGPQRVYVRLEAAPFIARLADSAGHLVTHNHLPITQVPSWWIDHEGHLYLQTEHGPARLQDRDLDIVADRLETTDGTSLLQWWSDSLEDSTLVSDTTGTLASSNKTMRLQRLNASQAIASLLGFIANPVH
jgi:hypothetical protein